MRVYDFDGTIYDGDSTLDFTLYCIRHKPGILRALPHWARALALIVNAMRTQGEAWDRTPGKEKFFQYLPLIKDIDTTIRQFWAENYGKIYPWYLLQKHDDDVIISAGPAFLLKPVCAKLSVTLIASMVDPATGRCLSPNCQGQRKVDRFREIYPNAIVTEFYSDSTHDTPMAKQALRAFYVKRGKVGAWPKD